MRTNSIALAAAALVALGAWLTLGQTWTASTGSMSFSAGVTNSATQYQGTATNGSSVAMPACTSPGTEGSRRRVLQNVGTVPLLYSLGTTVATNNYAGCLAKCTALRDGTGGLVDLSWWRGSVNVMVESSTGAWVVVEVFKAP